MDLATSHLGTDLDGLAALVAVDLLEGPFVLGLPGSMDPVATRFWRDHGGPIATLVAEPELRARVEDAAAHLGRLVVVDTARRERLGFLADHVDRFASAVAYDTHAAPDDDLPGAGLEAAAATVSPLVLRLAARGITPTPAQAGLFLLGVHADSGHLLFPNTSPVDYRAAALCAGWGAPLAWAAEYVPRGLDRHRLRLVERMAERVTFVDAGGHRVAVLSLDLDDYEPDLAPLVDVLRRAEGWAAALLIAADPRRTTVIGRSDGRVDVAAALRDLGGGGHAEAASASLRACPMVEARALVIEALRAAAPSRVAAALATRDVYALAAEDTVDAAAAALHRYRINALPLTRDGEYVGLVSRREVDEALRHGLGGRAAISISTAPPARVAPDATLAEAREALLVNPGRLVLVGRAGEAPIGVLTRSDVFRAAAVDPPLAGVQGPPPPSRTRERLAASLAAPDLALVDGLGALAEELGAELYLVGGAVRDVLLGRAVFDLDLVVLGDAPTLGRLAVERHGGRVHVHEVFGTCAWTSPDGRRVDLTSARTESYRHPGALPDVARGGLRHDLLRRDFTVNAMALAVGPSRAGELVDPFGGQIDLDQRTLRVLHGLSFHDDPTRAWRAARFAGRFDFGLAPGTQALLREALAGGFAGRVGPERLGAELHKLLSEPLVVRCVAMLREWGLLAPIHPALAGDRGLLDRVARVREGWARYRTLTGAGEPEAGEPQWIALGWALGTEERRALGRLTGKVRGRTGRWVAGPTRVKAAIAALAGATRGSERAAALGGLEASERVCVLALGGDGAREAVAWWEREGAGRRSAVDGKALIALGAQPGPALRRALEAAQAGAWDGVDAEGQRALAVEALAAAGALPTPD